MKPETFTGNVSMYYCRTCGHFWSREATARSAVLCPNDRTLDDPHEVSTLEDVKLSDVPGATQWDAVPERDLSTSIGDRVDHRWPRDYVRDRENARFETCTTVADRAAAHEMNITLSQNEKRARVLSVSFILVVLVLGVVAAFAGGK